ncbi:MAG: hypothetical protein ACRDZ4_22230 [Egibacteraceae bacterium]
MLTKYAEGLLDEPLPADIATSLHELAARDTIDIQEAQDSWEALRFEDWEAQTVKNRLDSMVEFTSILKRLTNNFILLASTDALPGTRLTMRYCLDVPITFDLDAFPKEGLLEQLGWRSTRIDILLEAATETETYHFEVKNPPGLDLAMAAVCEYLESEDGTTPEPIIHDWQLGGLPRLNLSASSVGRGSFVVARVAFRPSRQGWLPAFVLYSWVLALLLLIGAWRLPSMMGAEPEIIDLVGVATALYPFIGLIARLVANSNEHGLTRKILSRLRQLAVITATLPALAVAGLVFVPTGSPLQWTWFCLGLTALLAAGLSTLSYILPKYPKALV